jgi:hypothetical protein
MEIEQMYVVSDFHRKGMKLPAIVAELAVVSANHMEMTVAGGNSISI